jgi:hypothetical protein
MFTFHGQSQLMMGICFDVKESRILKNENLVMRVGELRRMKLCVAVGIG